MLVKVCGLKDEKNIDDVSNLDIDFMGLIFYRKSKRFFDKDYLVKKNNKKIVGVFVNETIDEIKRISKKYDLDYVQLHGDESKSFCKEVSAFCNVIKAFRIDENFEMNSIEGYSNFCRYYLFDTLTKSYGGSGKKFNWDIILKYSHKKDFILSGGLSIKSIKDILNIKKKLPNLIGIDINSKFEIRPGLKDTQTIKKFINSIK
tara:strand:- start:3827 stop:4435 length:609 start_codon:yes stop_codon:yes gene_type:complete